MPTSAVTSPFISRNLAEVLRTLVQIKKTGILILRQGEQEGNVALENGMIVNAATPLLSGMHALFQFVGWNSAKFEFHEHSLSKDLPRDLSVYDPEVLIAGVVAKADSGQPPEPVTLTKHARV